ncbi:MAG TPA: glycosyltransferase family 4 protein [Blastocatellia bacterium]
MLILASVISNPSFHGGVAAVNQMLLSAAAAIPGTIVCQNDPHDAPWLRQWPDGFCAGGSRLRMTLGALSRRRYARDSITLVTHIGLAPVGRLIKQLTGGRLCAFLHGVEAWDSLPRRTEWGVGACDSLVANSNFTLKKFREANPSLSAIPGEVVYLPARTLADSNGNHNHPPRSALRALIVGRLWGRGMVKGQRQLIEIWPEVQRDFPGAELYVVGAGEGRSEFEELARKLNAQDAVRFTGEVTDEQLDALYASSDVYAMPSQGEGFGLVFAEAMSRGLPCIASRADAGSEVVVDGETGIHVDPDDRQELLRALKTLFGNSALRCRMGEAGRRRAEELFSLEAFNRKIERILRGEKRID